MNTHLHHSWTCHYNWWTNVVKLVNTLEKKQQQQQWFWSVQLNCCLSQSIHLFFHCFPPSLPSPSPSSSPFHFPLKYSQITEIWNFLPWGLICVWTQMGWKWQSAQKQKQGFKEGQPRNWLIIIKLAHPKILSVCAKSYLGVT